MSSKGRNEMVMAMVRNSPQAFLEKQADALRSGAQGSVAEGGHAYAAQQRIVDERASARRGS